MDSEIRLSQAGIRPAGGSPALLISSTVAAPVTLVPIRLATLSRSRAIAMRLSWNPFALIVTAADAAGLDSSLYRQGLELLAQAAPDVDVSNVLWY